MMDSALGIWETVLVLHDRGGVVMFPLGICSLLMVAVILERMWSLRASHIFPNQTIEYLRNTSKLSPEELKSFLLKSTCPVGRILSYGLSILPASAERFKEAVHDQARREVHYLERGLIVLEIIVGVAPLLGLLGTGMGMIKVFEQIAIEGPGRSEALSQGISEALLTTVLGLSIGIPALIAFNLFTRKIESLELQIEQEVLFFFHRLFPSE
ncbi:MAG: MotA/TolQ/ExbB proton channel family protein [SAR324 cluster bacterium]|nr:MotA/TolQ/ExbB proton channel family protein [SAR324 cluster bacterium]